MIDKAPIRENPRDGPSVPTAQTVKVVESTHPSGRSRTLGDLLFGRRLASVEEDEQQIGPLAGVPVLGLDALSSAAYGPEAALTLLLPLGALGLQYVVPITAIIVTVLLIVYVSLQGLGMKLSLVPYMNQSVWVQLKSDLGAEVDVVYLQCYQGGAGNDPGLWDSAFGGGFHVVPGQESNNHSASWWQGWSSADGVTGGFYGPDMTWAPGANWGVSEIAGGLGLPPN